MPSVRKLRPFARVMVSAACIAMVTGCACTGNRAVNSAESPAKVGANRSPLTLEEISRLEQKTFETSLPQLQDDIQQSSHGAADRETLTAIRGKLQQADESALDYWPTVLRFLQFASSRMAPNAPPSGQPGSGFNRHSMGGHYERDTAERQNHTFRRGFLRKQRLHRLPNHLYAESRGNASCRFQGVRLRVSHHRNAQPVPEESVPDIARIGPWLSFHTDPLIEFPTTRGQGDRRACSSRSAAFRRCAPLDVRVDYADVASAPAVSVRPIYLCDGEKVEYIHLNPVRRGFVQKS